MKKPNAAINRISAINHPNFLNDCLQWQCDCKNWKRNNLQMANLEISRTKLLRPLWWKQSYSVILWSNVTWAQASSICSCNLSKKTAHIHFICYNIATNAVVTLLCFSSELHSYSINVTSTAVMSPNEYTGPLGFMNYSRYEPNSQKKKKKSCPQLLF